MDFPKQFISRSYQRCTPEQHVPAPLFRKTFSVEAGLISAHLFITGLGFYELYVNGHKITRSRLAPFITAPDDIVTFDQYDLLSSFQTGKNVIGVILGNGMQNAHDDVWNFEDAAWVGPPQLTLALELAYENGQKVRIESDESFLTSDSAILFDSLRQGEIFDANAVIDDWAAVDYDDSHWSPAVVTRRPAGKPTINGALPILPQLERRPVSIIPSKNGYLYDFGINSAGIFRLKIEAQANQRIELYLGEWVENNELKLDNIEFAHAQRGPHQKVTYIAKEGLQQYEPTFTYFGFRYIYVEGITPGQATEELLTYIVQHTDLSERGNFHSSCETLNALQKMVRNATLSNFQHLLTDCPQREKNGWTGDIALSAEHILLNLNPEANFVEWLKSVRAVQTEAGKLPGIIPTGGWGFHWGNGPAWDCVLTLVPYYVYKYRGDIQILEDNATAIFRYLEYLSRHLDERGLIDVNGLGDWCHAGRMPENNYIASLAVTDSLISMDIAQKAAFIFETLGMSYHERFANDFASQLRFNIRQHLIDFEAGLIDSHCQTAQAMGLFYDVLEAGEKPLFYKRLRAMIKANDDLLDVGILGGRVLFHVLVDHGDVELAYNMIATERFPSYGNWVNRGFTALPESFFAEGERPLSLNHHFWGDISNFFMTKLAGIKINPTGKDINNVDLSPSFIQQVDSVTAYHELPAGKVEIAISGVATGHITIAVNIATGLHGQIKLPSGFRFEDGSARKDMAAGIFKVVRNG